MDSLPREHGKAQLKHELATSQDSIGRLCRYIPSIVAQAILNDPDRLRGERREIAVLFADAVNFTRLSASLDAEAVFNLINDLLSRLVDCVHRYDGLVDKFTGDGLMAVFGAPIAHENDSELAVRVALDMQKAATEFAPIARSQIGAPIEIRIGIHSGPAISGILGTEQQAAYTVIGETVNLAARLESLAQPGHILVSSRVHHQTQPFFNFHTLDTTHIKGVDLPVTTYEVSGARATPTPTRGVPGIQNIFLGHEEELKKLNIAIDTFIEGPKGRLAIIRGEAGMGKSRLVAEWLSSIEAKGLKAWHGRGLPYAQGIGYSVFRSLLQNAINNYHPGTRWERHIGPSLRPYLKQILELPLTTAEQIPLTSLAPERIKQLTALAFRNWLLGETSDSPVILILDDFHWADNLSYDLLETLLKLIHEAPIFFCIITRPHAKAPLNFEECKTELSHAINVTPLTQEHSRSLLGNAINLEGLTDSIIDTILTRAEGNPFYIEEFVRMLIEKELLRLENNKWQVVSQVAIEKINVPTSLRGLMMARVDRLPQNLRHVLLDAAVVGLQFDSRLLEKVERHFYDTENITPALERLTDAGLLEKCPDAGPNMYAFRHILTQETIYSSILHSQRPELHRIVAEATEVLYRSDLQSYVEILALHYDRARIHNKALHYMILAGHRARHRFANLEAIEYYGRALQISQHLSHRESERWQAVIGLGEVQQHLGEYEEAIACYRAALEEWKNAPPGEQAEVMLKLGRAWYQRGDLSEAETWLRQAITKIGKKEHELPAIKAEVHSALGWLNLRRGDLVGAQEMLEEALTSINNTQHYYELASVLNRLGAVYYNQGDLDRATQSVERALAIREKLGDLLGVARSSNNLGILKRNSGNWKGALENYQRCIQVMEEIGDIEGTAIAHTNIGNAYIEMGIWEEAESNLLRSFEISKRIANPYETAQAHMNLGRLYLAQEDYPEAELQLTNAIKLYSQAGARANPNLIDAYWLEGTLHLAQNDIPAAKKRAERIHEMLKEVTGEQARGSSEWGRYEQLMGRIALATGEYDTAYEHLKRSQEIFETSKTHNEAGRSLYWIALVWIAMKKPEQARIALTEAESIFDRLGAFTDLARTQDKLKELDNTY